MNYLIKEAKEVWKTLNGVFNIYKPQGIHYEQVKSTVIQNLCKDLNELRQEKPCKYVSIEGPTNKKMLVTVRDSYAENPLVVGPAYIPEDIKLKSANIMDLNTSGVLIFGINHGTIVIENLRISNFTTFHKLKGILGQARDNNFMDGRIVEKSTWKHIKRYHIDRVCAAMQASWQKKIFELCGVSLESEAAYQLAVKGPVRPLKSDVPMIYSVKCINFEAPEFTIEIVGINVTQEYLKKIVAEIGYKLHSTAHCNYIQCSQFGLFNINDSLLSKQWNLQNILNNINLCQNILLKNTDLIDMYHNVLVAQEH